VSERERRRQLLSYLTWTRASAVTYLSREHSVVDP